MKIRVAVIAVLVLTGFSGHAGITGLEATPLFPKPAAGQPLQQRARLSLDNSTAAKSAKIMIAMAGQLSVEQDLGELTAGKQNKTILLPDIATPTELKLDLFVNGSAQPSASWTQMWQPQKKWTIYCCSFSHQDLGFGDYPHRLRTSIRHANISLPLQYCRETDSWPEESKYRFNIETSEPITSFISFNGKDAARELAQRMREGRIELGRLHNTANTEELSHELMARLFYMSGRYAPDLLSVPAGKVMQNDDVIGLTWPLASYAAEADIPYFFHGANPVGHCEIPAESEPVFYWNGPESNTRVLERASPYSGAGNEHPNGCTEARIVSYIRGHAANHWPYHALLMPDGDDFTPATRALSNQVRAWDEKYAWPRLVCGTFQMFFDDIAKQANPSEIKSFTGDSNNQWSDQDYAAAATTGQARRMGELLPTTETLASIAQVVAGGGGQWTDMMQAYHRLLQYWEHSNGQDASHKNMVWYETEREENHEMVTEAAGYQERVFTNAARRLAGVITRTGKKNLVVFNPLPQQRTDVVRAEIPAESVVDSVSGAKIPVQQLPDGSAIFIAQDVPATGYKVYSLDEGAPSSVAATDNKELESEFYRINWNPETGALTSLYDKKLGVELIETNAPHAFNGYLYEDRAYTGGLNFDSTWSRMDKAASIAVSRGTVADILTVTGKATGVRALRQTVILYHNLPRVDFGIWMDKAPSPLRMEYKPSWGCYNQRRKEAVYVGLPLAVPNFTIHHELPGAVIEPYREQFKGSATDHYAIRGFTDLSNDKYGVTISPIEGGLVCYGAPTSSPMTLGNESNFKRDQTYPTTSRVYLYLLNNMFDMNINVDQQGPVEDHWSLHSHSGDWKAGGADKFGRSVQQPLVAWRADGKNSGSLPASGSFMSVDAPNVMCGVIKPAEANGRGFIIRLNETIGTETTATVSLPMLNLESARATSLVENDRTEQYPVTGHSFKITLPKFGVKTIRVTCAGDSVAVSDLSAKAVADMQVDLSWKNEGRNVSHFNIYRDTQPDCAPTQLNFIGQSATGSFSDRPRVNLGGWLRSCLAPKTTYYYRIVPVDRANNPGAPSAVATVTTPDSAQANLLPVAIEGLRAILVSPISKDNFVNLLFRTACEPDVVEYEIHRGTQADFATGTNTLVGTVNSDDIPPRSGGYGEQKIIYKVREYDHATFTDKTVEPSTTYYYKARAVDAAGQKGAFSDEVAIRTKDVAFKTTAQSINSPEFGADNAVDSNPDPFQAWISKQYGGGTKDKPLDTWWQIELLKKPITIKGVKIIGDHRDVIPLQKNLQVQAREAGVWKTVGEVKDATTKDVTITFAQPVTTDALRVFVPAANLPHSDRADVDGIVRICELHFILPDGTEREFGEAVHLN